MFSTPIWRAVYLVFVSEVSIEQLILTATGMAGVICVSQIWLSGSANYSLSGVLAATYVGASQAVSSAWTGQLFVDQPVARSALGNLLFAVALAALFALVTFGLSVEGVLSFPDARLSGTSTALLLITGSFLSAGGLFVHGLFLGSSVTCTHLVFLELEA